MTHEQAWTRLPDLLADRDEPALLAHVTGCNECQRQLFLLGRVDRILQDAARKRDRRRLRARALLAAVALVAALLAIVVPRNHGSQPLTLRSASGETVGRALLERADADNTSLMLVARGLPTRRRDVYVLWAGDGSSTVSVGRFMVDARGSCRVRFNLPGGRRWARFWVTPPGNAGAVVAST